MNTDPTSNPTSNPTGASIQQLVDRNDVTDLVYRLVRALDEGRFDEMAELLLADATARTPGGLAEGRDAVVAQARRNHQPGAGIQHVTSDLLVDLDGDLAQVRANLNVTFAAPAAVPTPSGPGASAPPVQYELGAVYRFGVARTPAGWRFSAIEAIPVWATGERPVPAPA